MARPIIGITCDTVAGHSPEKWKYESPHDYARAVVAGGGVPFLLPYETPCIPEYLRLCGGFLLSGGDDPDPRPYGQSLHPKANLVHPERQAFEAALLRALDTTNHPVLGVCLGMQMMALHAGGRLHQHLPDVPGMDEPRAAAHYKRPHAVVLSRTPSPHLPRGGTVYSVHHQSVADPGGLRVLAEFDAVIEALDRPDAGRFYLGVQWHPERTTDHELGSGLIGRFVQSCAARDLLA